MANARSFDDTMTVLCRFKYNFLIDAVHDRFNVRDDAEHFSFALLASQTVHHVFQSHIVERSKTFVHEKRFDADVSAGKVCNSERKRKANQEFLATREIGNPARCVEFSIVHFEAQVSFGNEPLLASLRSDLKVSP